MTDYEPLLRRLIATLDRPDERTRFAAYDRAREALIHQMQVAGRSDADIEREIATLQDTVLRLEQEVAGRSAPPDVAAREFVRADDMPMPPPPAARGSPGRTAVIVGVAAVVAVIVAGSAAYLLGRKTPPSPHADAAAPAVSTATPSSAAPAAAPKQEAQAENTASYILRRQRIFYRTTHPPGTIVVSLSQRFLYVVQPNQVAIRYAIGVGPDCETAKGLFHVTQMVAKPKDGQPSGPFAPPAVYFDARRAVHEATEPNLIGQSTKVGCFQSWDDDIADLFKRIALNERVVVAN
jgi:lipoprotein-anchoring transpeptidase ErfK/SrfK